MDAITRTILLGTMLAHCICMSGQQMNWSRYTEDTIYYANEYLPERIRITPSGPGQRWDLRSLRAPYAISRRIVLSGDQDNTTYGQFVSGKQTKAIVELSGRVSRIVQMMEDNPVCPSRKLSYALSPSKKPFFNGVFGASTNYDGKMQAVFSWPRDINCKWRPAELPDSCRITYFISEEIIVDADGTLFLPTEVSSVYRQHINEKRTLKIEVKRGSSWKDVTSQVPGIQLISYKELYRFVSTSTGVPLVDIEVKDELTPVRIEFKTHPLVTRVLNEEPNRPDVFAYPNPSFDVVRFQLSDLLFGRYSLKIFNILGVAVKETVVDVDHFRKTISIDLSDLQRGTYLYRLQDAFGRTIKTKRVVLIEP